VLFVVLRYLGDTLGSLVELSSCYLNPSSDLTAYSPAFSGLIITEAIPPLIFILVLATLMVLRKLKFISWNDSMLYAYNLFWFLFCGIFSLPMLKALVVITACSHIGDYKLMLADKNIDC